jgi:MFS family permease
MASFLARGDSIIITIFVPLWVYKYYIEIGSCPSVTGPEDPDLKESCKKAYITAAVLSGVAQTLALVGAPLFGYLTDKLYRPFSILLAGVIGCLGYLFMFLESNPSLPIMYLIVSLAGLGEIGMVVGSLSLVTSEHVPVHVRGSVAGLSSFCGALGILINTKLGGYLFDVWRSGAPFFLMAVGHILCTLLALGITISDLRKRGWSRERSLWKGLKELDNGRDLH